MGPVARQSFTQSNIAGPVAADMCCRVACAFPFSPPPQTGFFHRVAIAVVILQ